MSWLRTNRWWLPLLPLVVIALVAASSYRVKAMWYDTGLHHAEAPARPGGWVSVTDDYDDVYGATHRTFDVRLSRIGTAATLPPTGSDLEATPPPAGTEVLVAHLDWRADPGQSLTGCSVALVDGDGARYEVPTQAFQPSLCVPAGRPGPDPPFTRATHRGDVLAGDARPDDWSTSVSVLAPRGTDVVEVLVWWDEPDYVALPVPSS